MVSPAAGPLTDNSEPERIATIVPPMIPEIRPAISGVPEAKAIPKQRGNATRKTDIPDFQSFEINDFK